MLCLLLLLFAYNITPLQSASKRQLTVQSPTHEPSASSTECTDLFILIRSATEESGADFAMFAGFVGTYSTSNNLEDWLLTDWSGNTEVEGNVADSSLSEIDGKFTLLDVDAPFAERIYYHVPFSDWSYFGGASTTPFNGRRLWNVYGDEIELYLDIQLIDCDGNMVTYPTPIPTERPSNSPTPKPSMSPTDIPTLTIAPSETPTISTERPSMSPTDIPTLTIVPSDKPTISPTNCTTQYMNIVNVSSDKYNNVYQIYVGKYAINGSNYENWQHESSSTITGSVNNSGSSGSHGYFFLTDSSQGFLEIKFVESAIDDWVINGGTKVSPVGTREWIGEILETTLSIEIILQDCYGNTIDFATPAPSDRPSTSPTDKPTPSPVCTHTSATIENVTHPFDQFKVFEGTYTLRGTNNDE